MEFKIENVAGVAIVAVLTDVLDASNAKEFKTDITPILEKNDKVLLDMGQVNFLDSSGCGMILSCLRTLNSAGGDLKMVGLQKPVRTLFELIRMHRVIDIFNATEEAVKSF